MTDSQTNVDAGLMAHFPELPKGHTAEVKIRRTDLEHIKAWISSPRKLEWVSILRHMITTGVGYQSIFTEDTIESITSAVGEALANAVKHGVGRVIYVSATFNAHSFTIEIVNNVRECSFQCKACQSGSKEIIRSACPVDVYAEHGRGFPIMACTMDEVTVCCDQRRIRVRLTKYDHTPSDSLQAGGSCHKIIYKSVRNVMRCTG